MNRRQTYIAQDGVHTLIGHNNEIAEQIGCMAVQISRAASTGRSINGYYVRPRDSFRVLYLATWDGGFTRKTIKGTAVEISRETGLSTSHVRSMARSGKQSFTGWTIERITS